MDFRRLETSGLLVFQRCLGTKVYGVDTSQAADEETLIRGIHQYLDASGGN